MQHYQECLALGSKTGLSLVSEAQPVKIKHLYHELWRAIFLFERRFSRFLPDSELSVFNRNAGMRQTISMQFRDILTAARDLAIETGGLFNPFVLPALQAAGYSHSRVPGHEQDAIDDHSTKAVADINRLEICNDWARIPYGTAIDLGGCGKGYLADQIRLKLPGIISGYWLSLGGDIAIGGYDDHNQPWKVAVEDAYDPSQTSALITVDTACGIATSGVIVHSGQKAGGSWHHIINPRTRQPAKTDILLATVHDVSSLKADVLATCSIILGSKQGLKFLKARGVKSALLQCQAEPGKPNIMHFGKSIELEAVHA